MMPPLLSWPLTVVVCVGLVVAAVRRRDGDVLLLLWFVVWAGIVGLDGRRYSRYYVPLLPAMALLATRGLWGIGAVVRPRWLRVAATGVCLGVVTGWASVVSVGWARLYAVENSRTLAGEWIREHVAAGARVGVTKWPWQFEMPPLDPQRYRLVVMEDSPEGDPLDVSRLLRERPDYFVTSSLQSGRMLDGDAATGDGAAFWRTLRDPQLYRQAYVVRLPLVVLGREIELWGYPEDMRYVNPTVYVLERATAEAAAPSRC